MRTVSFALKIAEVDLCNSLNLDNKVVYQYVSASEN